MARGTSAATATMVATYQYDANGNRVSKTLADGTKIAYLVDGNYAYAQVAQETAISPTGATTETDYLYGLERIALTRAGQGTYYHDDGLGSTRLLTDPSGNVTDSYEYDDYGALQSQTGATKNDFMYAGEAYDQEANLYYNRARYLDTNTGRFVGLDPYAGNLSQPITLNKYAYANSDPVNGRDPSGLTNMSETSAAENIASELSNMAINYIEDVVKEQISNALLGPLEKFADSVMPNFESGEPITGNAGIAAVLIAFAELCEVRPNKCYLKKIPTLVNGSQTPMTTEHIFESLMGVSPGTLNGPVPLPFLLFRKAGRNDVPYYTRIKSLGCRLKVAGEDCDEYPYASTWEGGKFNYEQGMVSLKPVPSSDNRRQGSKLRTFYRGADIRPMMPFLNLALPAFPGFYINKRGQVVH